MGVEYLHFLVVEDKDWLPQADTLTRIDDVLRKWSLVSTVEKVFDLSNMTEAAEKTLPYGKMGPGFGVSYRNAANGKCVEVVAGESHYDTVSAEDRYIDRVIAVVGEDFRIHKSDEQYYFEVTSPNKLNPLERDIPYPISKLFDDFQSADVSTTPPSVKMRVTRSEPRFHDWEIYNGFWRGGVALDFGKDLPKFCEEVRVLPSREFVNDLAEAFRAPLVELGSFY